MNKMMICVAVMFVAAVAGARDIRLDSGMPVAKAAELLSEAAIDLTPAVEVDGLLGQKGVCWQLTDVNLVVWLYSVDGKLTEVGYWTKRDFSLSALIRAETERRAVALVINPERGSVLVSPAMREYEASARP